MVKSNNRFFSGEKNIDGLHARKFFNAMLNMLCAFGVVHTIIGGFQSFAGEVVVIPKTSDWTLTIANSK